MRTLKKIIALIAMCAALLSFTACASKQEIGRELTDVRYTPSRQELVTTYDYKYNWWSGEFVLVPNTHTETMPEKYEVQYIITYDDETTESVWVECTKTEYETALAALGENK